MRNYNSVDADQEHGGTQIQDIITYAYNNNHFKNNVKFMGLIKPQRFKDKAKFEHCLGLFDFVVTEEQLTTLRTADLDMTEVENVANAIKDSCLEKLQLWESKPNKGKVGEGYTGVGSRVQKLKTKYGSLGEIQHQTRKFSTTASFD